jgi:tetratricopeptide (TPR) repeat protein
MHVTPGQPSSATERTTAPVAETPARRIADRYEVVTKLFGGMAIVYLCRDLQTNQPVALKSFKPELLSHRIARDLFLREGTMWVELGHHPHIVRAHRVERIGDGREVYLVLEWVVQPRDKGTPAMRSWLKPGKPLPFDQSVLFALHVARGMRFATGKITGLVHRDLKPENILIGHDHRARVADFGLASALSGMSPQALSLAPTRENFGRTQLTQGVVGTPLYMAPEQWRHEPLDARADIYALGCIFYEMIAGQFAAKGNKRSELRKIHLSGRIDPPPSSVPDVLVKFLQKCLVADRNRRYVNWAEVEKTLETVYRSISGQDAPSERTTATETQAERLANGYSYNDMGLSYLDIGKLDVAVMYFEQAVGIGRVEGSVQLEGQGLGNLGLAYMSLGYVDRAIEFHDEHLAISREIGDKAEEGRAFGNLGRAYRRLGDAEQAVSFHEEELAISRDLNDQYKEAAALDSLGETHWQLGEKSKAVSLFKESLAIARGIGDRSRVKSILNNMGRVYLASDDLKEAMALFQQSLEIAREMGDHVGEGEALGDLGDLHYAVTDMTRATEFYKRALTISQESNDRRRESHNLMRLGDILLSQGNAEEAIEHYEAASAAIEEIGDKAQELEAAEKLGRAYFTFKDFLRAASHYKRMLDLARETEDSDIQRQALVEIAKAFEHYGDLRRTAKYLGEHMAISREQGDLRSEVNMLNTLGAVFREMQDLRSARKMYGEYLAIARETGNHKAAAHALNKLGDVDRERGLPLDAQEYYKAALDLTVERGNKIGEAATLGNMSLAYSDLGKKWQASRYGERALKTALTIGDPNAIALARFRLATVLTKQKKWPKALSHAKKAKQLFVRLGEGASSERVDSLLRKIEQLSKQ